MGNCQNVARQAHRFLAFTFGTTALYYFTLVELTQFGKVRQLNQTSISADGMNAIPTATLIFRHSCRVEIYLDRLKQRLFLTMYRILLNEQFSVDKAGFVPIFVLSLRNF